MGSLLSVGCGKQESPKAMFVQSAGVVPNTTAAKPIDSTSPAEMRSSQLESTNLVRVFETRGVIRELPVGGQTVLVRHEEIAGFMPAMTMEFTVRETNELRGLLTGDTISFRLKVTEEESWIEGVQRANAHSPLPPSSGTTVSSLLHAAQLKVGDLLPDVEFLDEAGHVIKLSEFQGRALAFTFIFTRCPLPDFCPRMNQHFNRARELLLQRPGGPTNWQFLSISFDPEFDQPGVLTRYAQGYRGQNADRWLFAAASTNVLSSLGPQVDFRFANDDGNLVHNLRTVVLDPHRRIHRQFEGNRWRAEELAQALTEAAQTKL